jgi:hypothetical protein
MGVWVGTTDLQHRRCSPTRWPPLALRAPADGVEPIYPGSRRRTRIVEIVDGYCRIAGPVERHFRQAVLRPWPCFQMQVETRSRDRCLSTMVKTAPFAPIALACLEADGIITRRTVLLELLTTSARLVRRPSTSLGVELDGCWLEGRRSIQAPEGPPVLLARQLSGAGAHGPRGCYFLQDPSTVFDDRWSRS